MIRARVKKTALHEKLKSLAPEAGIALESEILKAALEMRDLARGYVPVKEGDLQKSIVVTRAGEATPAYSQPGGSEVVPAYSALVTAGNSAVRYPHLVEHGVRAHIAGGKFAGAQIPAIPAQPYFWPAFRMIRRRFRSRMTRAINKAVKKVAGQ